MGGARPCAPAGPWRHARRDGGGDGGVVTRGALGRLRDRTGRSQPRRTNLALLLLLVVSLASGVVAFGLGTGWVVWAVVVHGATGLGLLVLSAPKVRLSRRGLRARPPGATWPSITLGVLVVVTVVSGVLHATGVVLTYGPLDDMQVHVGAALLATPLLLWHVAARGPTPARQDLSRRTLLRTGLLVGSSATLWAAVEGTSLALDLPGADRRPTGSLDEGSHDPDRMPAIIWLLDPRLDLDADAWRLTVTGLDGTTRRLGLADLATDDRVTATLDCTSGWFAEQDWHGTALPRLLGDLPRGARSVVVTSATGYARRFPVTDVPHLLLATGYEGRPLAARHGFPARLVAPGRRGFWWVKWVTRIEVSDLPWWRQPPFPLQ